MNKLLHLLLLSTCMLTIATAAVADDKVEVPDDFAYGASIVNLSANAPFYKLKLPQQVYLNTANADLRDIRVFNDRGTLLPFSLQHVQYQQQQETKVELTLVPLTPSEIKQNSDGYQIEIQAKGNSTLNTTIKLDDADWDKDKSSLYLVKLPQTDKLDQRSLDRLVLQWKNLNHTWQAKVVVSSEYDNEYSIEKKGQISELSSANEHLLLNRIELRHVSIGKEKGFLLLKLQLENGEQLPEITAVEGISVSENSQEDKMVLDFPVEMLTDKEAIYTLPNEQAIDSLDIIPQQYNSLYPVSIEYKTKTSADWISLSPSISIYNFDEDNKASALKFPQKNIKQLRIKALNGSWGDEAPKVTIQRDAVYVFFNAQGHQNLILAWGAANVDHKALPIVQLIPNSMRSDGEKSIFELSSIELASLDTNNIITLGGETRLTDLQSVRDLKQKYLLWGLLLFGVVILGYLAFKLWGDIQKANTDNS